MKTNNMQTTAVTLTYDNGHTCRLCGCPLYDGYPFTVCDDCWPKTEIGRDEASEPDWKSLAMKLYRITEAASEPNDDTDPELASRELEYRDAYAAITDAEWAALEGG